MTRMWGAALCAIAVPASAGFAQGPSVAVVEEGSGKPGSLHLQCDGKPNNVTAGETAARLLGAVTLLGLFAPPPEAADASKRKFGADGVAACTRLIDGDKREGNARRLTDLILARALHRIEAKDYEAALADVALERRTAESAKLTADPYYARSRGRAAALIEAAALYRLGRTTEARDAALRDLDGNRRHHLVGLIDVPGYLESVMGDAAVERGYVDAILHAFPPSAAAEADRMEEQGRFADAARLRLALVSFNRGLAPKSLSSALIAQAALTQALAGETAAAATLAADAQANFDARKAAGKPETNPAHFVELMDLYGIVRTADAGDLKTARRLFAGRSQWPAAPLGSTMEVCRRLRDKAAPDELIGALAATPAKMRQDRLDTLRAATLAADADNKTLFGLIPAAESSGIYESLSKKVWKTDKSAFVATVKKDESGALPRYDTFYTYGIAFNALPEAYALHAALLARARGHQGFVMMPIYTPVGLAARVLTGNPGEAGLPEPMFNDAGKVIEALSPIIPSPDMLKQRQAERERAARAKS